MTTRPLLVLITLPVLAQTGQISVSVRGTTGAAVAGARVSVSTMPVPAPSGAYRPATPFNNSQTTAADGSVAFRSVPQGAYSICAYPADGIHVDSCSWEERGHSIYVHGGQTVPAAIHLKRGQILNLEITDANQLVPAAPLRDKQLNLAIRGPKSHPQALRHTLAAATVRRASAFVPVDTDLELLVASFGFDMADSAGRRLQEPSRTPVRIRIAAGQPAATVRLSVLPKR